MVPLLLLGVLAGCSADDSGSSAASDSGGAAAEAPQPAELGGDDTAADSDAAGRQVVTSGSVHLTSPKPREAADDVVALVERVEGRVDERYERASTPDQEASAELVVRVPSDDLTPTLDALEDIGTLASVDLAAEDVTARSTDLDARIRSLQVSVARMEALLGRATTSDDVIAAEAALAERQTTLETLQSQRARLAEQVALSTLRVSITEPSAETVARQDAPEGFLGGLAVGWSSLVSMLRGLVLVLGVLLPWLVVAAPVLLGVVRLRQSLRRRRPPLAPQPYPTGPWAGVPVHAGGLVHAGTPSPYGATPAAATGAHGAAPVADAGPPAPGAQPDTQPDPDPTPNPTQER